MTKTEKRIVNIWRKTGHRRCFTQEEAREALGFSSRSGAWAVLKKAEKQHLILKVEGGYEHLLSQAGLEQRADWLARATEFREDVEKLMLPPITRPEDIPTNPPAIGGIDSFLVGRKAKKEAKAAKRTAEGLADRVEALEEQLAHHTAISDALSNRHPKERAIRPRLTTGHEDVPVMCFSDLHAGETVEPKHVNHLNEWNESICTAACEATFSNFLSRVQARRRGGSTIKQGVLWLGGDLMTGFLHEDQQETNWMSPIEETIFVFDRLRDGIDFLRKEGGFERLDIICNYGNHGRTTKKPRSAGAETSFEWGIYKHLAREYGPDDGINFIIANGYMVYHDVLDARCCFHHGDAVRYGGGIGGLSIPLNKAIASWARSGPAAYHILGHYHQWLPGPDFFVNGSVIGYSPYALKAKCAFEEPQQGLLWFTQGHKRPVAIERIWCRPEGGAE